MALSTNDKQLVTKLEKNVNAMARLNKEIEKVVGDKLTKLATLKEQDEAMRAAIQKAMEDNGVTKFDGDLITITYTKPTQRTTFDSKKFQAERPKTYEKYLRTSAVKGSIKLKLKA